MIKERLIKRLSWYYPVERFHAFLSFPALLVWLLVKYPFGDIVSLSYGVLVCIVILIQGQKYWKLKLDALNGKSIDHKASMVFFKKSKVLNLFLIGLMPLLFWLQRSLPNSTHDLNQLVAWALFANAFAILEHVNYYHRQLMVDNWFDLNYILKHRKLKIASLAKDLKNFTALDGN